MRTQKTAEERLANASKNKRAEKERAEKEKSRKRIITELAIVSVIFLILSGVAISQRNQAVDQKQILEEKTNETRASYLNLKSKDFPQDQRTLEKSVLLAIESFRIYRT